MLIDWFTVFAQIVNFLILMALLKYFLYGRILKAMEGRQKRIADELAEAERKRAEAEAEADTYRRKKLELEEKRRAMLSAMKEDVAEQRRKLMAGVHEEIEEARARWNRSVRREQGAFLAQLRQRVADEVCRVSRKALQDLGNTTLEESVAEVFVAKLRALDSSAWEAIRGALQGGNGASLFVRSAFPLAGELRRTIEQVLREKLSGNLPLAFETAEGGTWGIELRAGGRRVGWTLEDYLEDLEAGVAEQLARTADRNSA